MREVVVGCKEPSREVPSTGPFCLAALAPLKPEAVLPAPIPEHRILDAVLDVVAEHGFAGATTARMAKRAGTSEMTLFRRFDGKVGLLRAALEFEARRFLSHGVDYTGDLDDDLSRIVGAYEDLLRRRGRVVLAFFLEAPRHEDLRAVSEIPLQAIAAVTAVLARHQAEGRLKAGNPWAATMDLLSPVIVRAMLATAQPALATNDASITGRDRFKHGWAQE